MLRWQRQVLLIVLSKVLVLASQPLVLTESDESGIKCARQDLAKNGVRLQCDNSKGAIHINFAAVWRYRQVNYTACTTYGENDYFNTLTPDIAKECEGRTGTCTFLLHEEVEKNINYLEIHFECVKEDLITDWCRTTKEVKDISQLYLQTDGFNRDSYPPTQMSCTCLVSSYAVQDFTVKTSFMGLARKFRGKCKYSWWNVTVDGESKIGCEAEWNVEKTYDTKELTLQLETNHIAHNDSDGDRYRGGWLHISSERNFSLSCKHQDLRRFVQPTPPASIIFISSTQVTTPAAVKIKPTVRCVKTSTTRSTTTSTSIPTSRAATTESHNNTSLHVGISVAIALALLLCSIIATLMCIIIRRQPDPLTRNRAPQMNPCEGREDLSFYGGQFVGSCETIDTTEQFRRQNQQNLLP